MLVFKLIEATVQKRLMTTMLRLLSHHSPVNVVRLIQPYFSLFLPVSLYTKPTCYSKHYVHAGLVCALHKVQGKEKVKQGLGSVSLCRPVARLVESKPPDIVI